MKKNRNHKKMKK